MGKNILIKNLSEDKYWKWKNLKNEFRARDWEELFTKLIKFYKENG